jgi:hypothetical protein
MKAGSSDDLGPHGRRSRVVWYPGSTPPYSSLWITIQRFLMLNQPSRSAFAQDFLVHKDQLNSRRSPASYTPQRPSPDDHPFVWGQTSMNLTRFARVLKEPREAFRLCHIGQFSELASPYFGEFAVCPRCLGEGFHSVLYSFAGLQACPLHGTKLESLQNCSQIASSLFTHARLNPFGRCQYLQDLLGFPAARRPMAHPQRDRILGEMADWLMDIGKRCWLGQHGVRQAMPLDVFSKRVAKLRVVMGMTDIFPRWENTNVRLGSHSASHEIATFGSVKVHMTDLVGINDRRANRHQTDLSIYGQTIFGDFKAIRRYLVYRVVGRSGRRWLSRLACAASPAEVDTLLKRGREAARRAWLFLAWSRHVIAHEFNPKAGLHTRSIRFAISEEIPLWIANLGRKPNEGDHDFVRLWIARWISAAGLLAFWRSADGIAEGDLSPDIAVLGRALLEIRSEPHWGLGITIGNELTLCLDR